MDTIAMNTRLLEWDMIALAKTAAELKNTILECQRKSRKQRKKETIDKTLEELLLMQEELWQYIQNLEVIQKMYEETEEEMVSIVTSLS